MTGVTFGTVRNVAVPGVHLSAIAEVSIAASSVQCHACVGVGAGDRRQLLIKFQVATSFTAFIGQSENVIFCLCDT